jgi:hypothetical protein
LENILGNCHCPGWQHKGKTGEDLEVEESQYESQGGERWEDKRDKDIELSYNLKSSWKCPIHSRTGINYRKIQ